MQHANEAARAQRAFINSMEVGARWHPPSDARGYELLEAGVGWSNYRIDTYRRYVYFNVQNGRVVSVWSTKRID